MDGRSLIRTGLRVLPRSPRKRIAKRLLPRLAARGPYVANCRGVKMELDLRETSAYRYFATGEIDREMLRLMPSLVGPGGVVMDVGANLGYFAFVAAQLVGPEGRVVAFEPDPESVDRIRRNQEHNPALHVVLEAVAVSGASGEARFNRGRHSGVGSLLRDSKYVADEVLIVPSVTLDGYMNEHGFDRVDFVKMDIEGAEVLALQGMREGLTARRYRSLFLEWHGSKRDELSAVRSAGLEPLLAAGYRVRRVGKHLRPGRGALEPFEVSDLERRVHLLCEAPR